MDNGFVGGTNDNTSLTHLGAREYDAAIGRFASVDPVMDIADPQQAHGFSYANNNPVTFSDVSGLLYEDGKEQRNDGSDRPAPGRPQPAHPTPQTQQRVQIPLRSGVQGPQVSAPAAPCASGQVPPCFRMDDGRIGDQAGNACMDFGGFIGPVANRCQAEGVWGGATPVKPTKDKCGRRDPVIGPPRGPQFVPQLDKYGVPVRRELTPEERKHSDERGFTVGICVGLAGGAGWVAGGSICIVSDLEGHNALVFGSKLGRGVAAGGPSVGVLISNAYYVEQLEGSSAYVRGALGVEGEFSIDEEGIWQIQGGLAAKAGGDAGVTGSKVWRLN